MKKKEKINKGKKIKWTKMWFPSAKIKNLEMVNVLLYILDKWLVIQQLTQKNGD